MSHQARRTAVGILAVLLAFLLPVAVVAAALVERPTGSASGGGADRRVGAAGLGLEGVADEPTVIGAAPVTVAAPAAPPPPVSAPTSKAPPTPTTATTTKTRTTATLPPEVPWPATPPPTGIPNIAPTSSWQGERGGVSARLRVEPAVPVAGQPAHFLIDMSSAKGCCTVLLDFGDGSTGYSLNNERYCGDASAYSPGSHSTVATHTYAAAGAYKLRLTVMAADPCEQLLAVNPNGGPPVLSIMDVTLDACLAVGPGSAGQAGCSPFPTFGPDTLVSPVMDPFCQIRSDCTKASTPR